MWKKKEMKTFFLYYALGFVVKEDLFFIHISIRQAGAEAAGRARMVNEFLSRKREAAAYKARAAVQLGWAPVSY